MAKLTDMSVWAEKMDKDILELEETIKNFNIYYNGTVNIPQVRHKKALEEILESLKETRKNPIIIYGYKKDR